jgi:hypothetical protein
MGRIVKARSFVLRNSLDNSSMMSILSPDTEIRTHSKGRSKYREGKMGRTVMPYSWVMESERERLKPFRKALNKEDQEAFDRLFDRAKMHTSAGVYMANPWAMETILLSIVLEQGKVIEGILEKLKK